MYSVICHELVLQSSGKRRDKLHETLSRVTQHSTDRTFAKQIASTATESRTKFQLSPTAEATVLQESCPSHGMLNDAMLHTTHLSGCPREYYKTSCVKDHTE